MRDMQYDKHSEGVLRMVVWRSFGTDPSMRLTTSLFLFTLA
jgi:hypothetical protein